MRLVLAAVRAELLHLQAFRRSPLVLCLTVVPVFALAALELNNLAWHTIFLVALKSTGAMSAAIGGSL
jgi:hypothetical protein